MFTWQWIDNTILLFRFQKSKECNELSLAYTVYIYITKAEFVYLELKCVKRQTVENPHKFKIFG